MPRRTVLTLQLGTRRVHFADCTPHPSGEWVTQQARQLTLTLQDRDYEQNERLPIRCLIHDRDAKFTSSFNTVFHSEGIETVLTPFRSPKANAFAERWVRTVREECLDHLLIISVGHLRRVMAEYIEYYNHHRPHQAIGQSIPIPLTERKVANGDYICRREVLGGIIHDYYPSGSHAA